MARAMKDSGIPWIGEIPEEWGISRVGLHFDIILGKMLCSVQPSDDYTLEKYYCAANVHFDRVSNDELKQMWFSEVEKEQYEVENGDLLVVEGGAGAGGCAIVTDLQDKTYIQNSIMIVRAKRGKDNRYLRYLIECLVKMGYIDVVCNKATIPHFTKDKLANVPFLLSIEQTQIANFLDAECARIDAVIEQTRSSIEEYKKLKQAVITQAVTKGIRPNRPMKDSGIEWIGQVPFDWQVTKLKYFATIRSGITLGRVYPPGTKLVEYPYLRVANVQGSYTDLHDVATIAVTEEEAEKYRLCDGELLMTEGGDRDKLGRGTVWHAEIDPCLHQNHVFALRTNNMLLAEYVSYLSESIVGRDYFDVTANQSVHLASTNSTTILNFIIPYPPVNEQAEIVVYLKQKVSEIETIIGKKQNYLADMDAYKKSLIYEYVTGKKEVHI